MHKSLPHIFLFACWELLLYQKFVKGGNKDFKEFAQA